MFFDYIQYFLTFCVLDLSFIWYINRIKWLPPEEGTSLFKPIQKFVANRKLKEYQKLVQEINELEAYYKDFSDESLRELTNKW